MEENGQKRDIQIRLKALSLILLFNSQTAPAGKHFKCTGENRTEKSILMDFHTSLPLQHSPYYFLPLKSIQHILQIQYAALGLELSINSDQLQCYWQGLLHHLIYVYTSLSLRVHWDQWFTGQASLSTYFQ